MFKQASGTKKIKGHLRRAVENDTRRLKVYIRSISTPKKVAFFIILFLVIFGVLKSMMFVTFTDLSYNTDTHLCPACFGDRLCKKISEVSVHGLNKIHYVDKFMNLKNVYSGHIKDLNMYLKKLAHDDEISKLDRLLCDGRLSQCPQTEKVEPDDCRAPPVSLNCDLPDSIADITSKLTHSITVRDVRRLSDATYCPSQRFVNRMIERYQEVGPFSKSEGLSNEEKMRFLYTLALNQEPIVLQTFPGGEGWPFSTYIGACGRMVAVEDSGVPLQNYVESDWMTRIYLSIQLITIADHLTDNASEFKLYFSDVNLDNYVVDSEGQVRIPDAENIVVVDEQYLRQTKPEGWDVPYYVNISMCTTPGCLIVQQDSLCKTTVSDFNYYSICKTLFSNYSAVTYKNETGFLHSLPNELTEKTTLINLSNECANPSTDTNRIKIKEKLLHQLLTVYRRERKNHPIKFTYKLPNVL